MGEYVPEGTVKDIHSIKHHVENISETSKEKDSSMNDIAGLLALMQGNKNMDIPGLLALCKDKGYDRSFGNEFMFVFLLLFLFARGGWNGLNGAEQAAFSNCAGNNCQSIIGLHDRIADARSVSQLGFQSLQTWLCEAISNVTNSVRNQGDRAVDAARNVGDTVRDCCCKMEAALATLVCKVDGVSRDIRESAGLINAKIELEALKAENARAAMECRIIQNQKDCCCEMNQRFDKLENSITNNRLADENARLEREIAELKAQQLATTTANAAVQAMQTFQLTHYVPTKTSSTGTGTPA